MKKDFRIVFVFFILFILFYDAIFFKINLPEFLKWWDILLEIVLLIFFGWNIYNKKNDINDILEKQFMISYIMLTLVIITGLIGDVVFEYYHSSQVVIRDILTFLKFPLTFLLIKNLKLDDKMAVCLDKRFYGIMKVFIITILFFGIISLFIDIGMSNNEYRHGIRPYKFIFSHPTYLVMNMVFLLTLFESKKDTIKNINVYEIIIVIITFLTMRTKAIAFLAIFFLIKFLGSFLFKHKKISLIIIFVVLFITAYSKLALYASYSSSTREVLYKGCITIIQKCFSFGTGFGTYASYISGEYISKVYNFIDVSYVFRTGYLAQLGDVGYPYYIGQFGILGCIFLAVLMKKMIEICLINNENKMPVYILLFYILIGLTTESTLLNFGSEIAIILAIVSSKKIGEI